VIGHQLFDIISDKWLVTNYLILSLTGDWSSTIWSYLWQVIRHQLFDFISDKWLVTNCLILYLISDWSPTIWSYLWQVIGHQLSDLIIECEYGGYDCDPSSPSDFSQFYNNLYGNCYTFNSGWNLSTASDPHRSSELYTSKKPGPRYGLSLTFNVDQDEYIGELAESAGLRVVVHDQKRMPFPEDEGMKN